MSQYEPVKKIALGVAVVWLTLVFATAVALGYVTLHFVLKFW